MTRAFSAKLSLRQKKPKTIGNTKITIGGTMKNFLGLTFGVLTIFFLHQSALGASALKIGVVDIQKLQSQSKAFQKERAKLQKKFESMQKKLDDEETALRALEEDFKKQSVMLSLDAQEDKKRELERKRRYYKYLYEDFTMEMKEIEKEATKKVGKDLEKVLEKLAEKEGFILILERRTLGLIYYADAVEITDQVTEAYDKMFNKNP